VVIAKWLAQVTIVYDSRSSSISGTSAGGGTEIVDPAGLCPVFDYHDLLV
jgi:hypothetical protein